MGGLFSRRNAFLGWMAWTLAKWQLRRAPSKKPPRRRTFLRAVTAIAVLAALAALWARRSGGKDWSGQDWAGKDWSVGAPSGGDEPLT